MSRVFVWFSGLSITEKILVGAVAFVSVFSVAAVVAFGIFWVSRTGEAPDSATQNATQATTPEPAETTRARERTVDRPNVDLEITRAEWEGEQAEVEGKWSGELSFVHCDLFEGHDPEGESLETTDWWDREVPPAIDFPEQTFTQTFVEAEGRKVEDPIDPAKVYSVLCLGTFPHFTFTTSLARVQGTPPG